VDTFLRAWNVPLRLALRVRSYLAFVLKRQVSREQAALVNGGREVGEGFLRGGERERMTGQWRVTYVLQSARGLMHV
jgi:hypothetical protein